MAQTLSEIKGLLAAHGLRPKHRFGQNFLHDANQMRKILDAAAITPGEVVLEVGPGTGALSERLLEAGARLVAVEVDRDLEPILRQRLAPFGDRATLLIADALSGKHELNPAVIEALREAMETKPSTPAFPVDFPPALALVGIDELKAAGREPGEALDDKRRSRAYASAKAGDVEAAARVVAEVFDPKVVQDWGQRFAGAMLVAVHAVEAGGRNQLPIAYAQAIADVTGLAVDEQIVQSNVVAHTDANATQWLLARPTFDGPVEAGRPYILVDDAVGTGSTLAALSIHIQQGGGIPVFATALASLHPPKDGAPTEVLATRPETRRALDQAFDRMELEGILSHHGLPRLDQLTESQARFLLRAPSLDALRDRLAAARQAAGGAAAPGAVQAAPQGVIDAPSPLAASLPGAFKLVANLPYNVASPLLVNLAVDHPEMSLGVVMVQREVADRLQAGPESGKDYGPLSVIVQAMCEVQTVTTLPPGCFWPPPDVHSAVVRLVRRQRPLTDDPRRLSRLLHTLFSKRRKQIGSILGRQTPLPAGVDPAARPETLTVEQLVHLAGWLPDGPGDRQ